VRINDAELEVKHISLLYTVFRRFDTNRTVQIPNIVLNGLWIENVSRSKAMKEQVNIMIASSTSFDDVEIFRHELQEFVVSAENKRDFLPDVDVEIMGVGDTSKHLELRIEATHKSNWSNEQLRQSRRNKLLTAIISLMRTVPIYAPGCDAPAAGSAQLPNYSVSITKDDVTAAKEDFDNKKLEKRMYPVGFRPVATPIAVTEFDAHGGNDTAQTTGLSPHNGNLGRRLSTSSAGWRDGIQSRASIESRNRVDVIDFRDHATVFGRR
jgi:hypothetical protein